MRIFSRSLYVILLLLVTSTYASKYPIHAENAMVVTESSLATEVGVSVLKLGGNAIDAAVAAAFTLSVTYPEAGNIGGGGFMVIHFADGRNTTIDFREKAPFKAFEEMYLNEEGVFNSDLSTKGVTASGVPGSVAGLIYALEKYGTMSIEEVLTPAIEFAENGFPISYSLARLLNRYRDTFLESIPDNKVYLKKTGEFKEGDILKQKELAETLRRIKNSGKDGFYKGKTARLIVDQMKKNNGYISMEDLEKYEAVEREPVTGSYRGYEIVSMGPASSGGVSLIQALNALEYFEFDPDAWGSSDYIHTVAEVCKYVYANRSRHLGDIDFYPVPIENLISKNLGNLIYSRIIEEARPSSEINPDNFNLNESNETTHYCVVDENGNAVSVTTTINGLFGNKVIVKGAGFFLNNEMDDFSAKPNTPNSDGLLGNEANSIQPGKRMLSSMTPTIVLNEGEPFLLVGARGGSTIITTVLQIILNVVDFDMNIQEAIDAPRFHHQWKPDRIDHEKFTLPYDVKLNLIQKGHFIGRLRSLGKATGIQIDKKNKIIYGAPDSRGDGKALGY